MTLTKTMIMTLDMNDPMTKLSPLDIVLVTMVTFGPSIDFDQSWYMTLSMVTNLFRDIDDLIVNVGHCPGDHGHFWAIDRFVPKLTNYIVHGN